MNSKEHTQKIYDKSAKEYHNYISHKNNIWHQNIEKPMMVKFLGREIKGKKVLDLGCGSGPFIKKLNSLGAKKVIGLDLSPKLIEIARKENSKTKFYVGDAKKTPFKKAQFNVINSSLMAHYFKDQGAMLDGKVNGKKIS